jgi:hypothetical protein
MVQLYIITYQDNNSIRGKKQNSLNLELNQALQMIKRLFQKIKSKLSWNIWISHLRKCLKVIEFNCKNKEKSYKKNKTKIKKKTLKKRLS